MTVPVVDAVARRYPDVQLTVLSRAAFRPMFAQLPSNVRFVGVDLKQQYKGLSGLMRLYAGVAPLRPTAVADLHDVLRTKFLRWRFGLGGVKVAHIDKGRRGRKALARPHHKVLEQQPTSFQKYARVFAQLGFPVEVEFRSIFSCMPGGLPPLPAAFMAKGAEKWVGIAPFAAHAGKIYPLRQMEWVVDRLAEQAGVRVFLFGGGSREVEVLQNWSRKRPNIVCVAGRFGSMTDELALMAHLNVMVSMDSANMHLASLTGTPVVSVWGATHPLAGFMGWNQLPENAIQVDLPCRPCSIYGNKPCARGDYACLNRIEARTVLNRVLGILYPHRGA